MRPTKTKAALSAYALSLGAMRRQCVEVPDTPLRGRCVGCSLPLAIHPSECPGPWRPPPCETDVPTPITCGDYGRLVRMPATAWDDAPYRSRLREAWDEMHPGEP